MSGTEFDTVFEDFVKRLVLTKTQKDRIDSVLGVAQSIFNDADAKMQGSFATGTTVKPLTEHTSKDGEGGEYDADIALLSKNWGNNSAAALKGTKSVLLQHYGSKVDDKERNSCERVCFDSDSTGVNFHADFVPLMDIDPTQRADRESGAWKESRTFEVIERYIEFDRQNNYASSCLLIFKRLRDYAGFSKDLPSIFLLAAHLNHYQQKESYRNDLISLCDYLIRLLESNEALFIKSKSGLYDLTENLTEKIENADQILTLLRDFRGELFNMSVDNLQSMQALLSVDFPTDRDLFPAEMESLRTNGLAFDTKNGLSEYEIHTSDHSNQFYRLITKGMEFVNPVKIKFVVSDHRNLSSSRNLAARWRITNDPSKIPEDVRGRLLGRSSGNEFIHINETAKYEGIHRAEVFITERQGNKVIGLGRYKVKKVQNL